MKFVYKNTFTEFIHVTSARQKLRVCTKTEVEEFFSVSQSAPDDALRSCYGPNGLKKMVVRG